jgi:arylsulfatase A
MGDSVIAGGKNLLTDAGTHVPLIVNWKGITPAGTICDDLVDFSDFLPTLAELSGAALPEVVLDGRSFAPQVHGLAGEPRQWIYQEHEGKAWIRDKRWKLYRDGRLLDVDLDPLEEHPYLPGEEADSLREKRAEFQDILGQLTEPG